MLYLITNQRRNVHFCLNTYILLNLEKTRIGRFFNITNWYEEIHSADEKYVIATIKNIKNKDLIDYSLYIKKGLVEPFIVFYNQEKYILH